MMEDESISAVIEIDRLRLYCYHGVLPEERVAGGWYEVSASLTCNIGEALVSDRIGDSVDYGDVIETIRRIMDKPVNLIEHAAYRICKAIEERYPKVAEAKIKVTKVSPPLNADMSGVSAVTGFSRQ